jgi:homoserine kinase
VSATAFAPATVANVAVGFDILGFAVEGVGDEVTVRRTAGEGVRIGTIEGVVTDLPRDPLRNTASVALIALLDDLGETGGFEVSVRKGIPLGSGMGGSAASAVAAVVAGQQVLGSELPLERLLRAALAGERAASGAAHADNAAAALYGGLIAVVAADPPQVERIPVPASIVCVLVHPHLTLETREARKVLPREIGLALHVAQSMDLCGFVIGCFRGETERIRRSMTDRVAEPARARSIPGFDRARSAALAAGALAFSISGSGPSVFAWADSDATARRVESGISAAFHAEGLACDSRIGPVRARGAEIVETRR